MAYVDNNVPYGSQILTIGATAYVAESLTMNTPSTVIERRDELGAPSGQVIIEGFGAGSGVLQLATTLTMIPAVGATATLTRNGGATAVTIGIVLSEVGDAYSQLESKKVNINFRRRMGT